MPSAGIFPPGFTITISFFCSLSISISTSFPLRFISAVLGLSPINFLIAVLAFDFALDSSQRPISINVMITTAVSKYTCGSFPGCKINSGNNVTRVLNKKAVPVPIATSEFISTEKYFRLFQKISKNLLPGINITGIVRSNKTLLNWSVDKGMISLNVSKDIPMLIMSIGIVIINEKIKSFLSLLS